MLFDSGDEVTVRAGEDGIRFLLISGQPLEEPVAWYGPIVMNTQADLQQAVSELRNGTFIKPKRRCRPGRPWPARSSCRGCPPSGGELRFGRQDPCPASPRTRDQGHVSGSPVHCA